MDREKIKERKRELAREWYKNNREEKLRYMKNYWATNPKQIKKGIERRKKWIKEHREEYNTYMREYYRKKSKVKKPYKQ